MRFDIVTIFPEFFRGPLDHGIVRRAQDAGLVEIRVQDLREFTHDRHRTVDDRPFGGGEGMVLKPEPLFAAVEHLLGRAATVASTPSGHGPALSEGEGFRRADKPASAAGGPASLPQAGAEPAAVGRVQRHSPSAQSKAAVVLLSASGRLFRQQTARRLAQLDRVILLCGRYEGVDERVAEHLATDELCVGDFVLSGGELAAALVIDAVTRLLPGALGNQDSAANESFSGSADQMAEIGIGFSPEDHHPMQTLALLTHIGLNRGILDYPHYTRPADFRGWKVPEVLLSGNHADVRRWRRKMALIKTARHRLELLAGAQLSDDDRTLLSELQSEFTEAAG